jgi:hypothetical protein
MALDLLVIRPHADDLETGLGAAWRENRGWPDRGVTGDAAQVNNVVRLVRKWSPRAVAIPYWGVRHPDHGAASRGRCAPRPSPSARTCFWPPARISTTSSPRSVSFMAAAASWPNSRNIAENSSRLASDSGSRLTKEGI